MNYCYYIRTFHTHNSQIAIKKSFLQMRVYPSAKSIIQHRFRIKIKTMYYATISTI